MEQLEQRQICPHLPMPGGSRSYRGLNRLRKGERGEAFYLEALRYSHHLWLEGFPARALLALTRALYAPLQGDEPALRDWPVPYRAFDWMLHQSHNHSGFLGNPRVSFQHQAGRMRGLNLDQRVARAWAVWALVRKRLPHLPRDPRHQVVEPTEADIERKLEDNGIAGEAAVWRAAHAER